MRWPQCPCHALGRKGIGRKSVLGRFLITFIFMSCSAAAAETKLDQFFPSNPIHEDDRISGNFEASIEGCRVKLTEISGERTTVGLFDVRNYQTDPRHLARPYAKQLSTRYNVAWFARPEAFNQETENLKAKLRDLRISLKDRSTLSPSELQAKSIVLESWLSEIRSGSHGTFAQRNHTLTLKQGLLTFVWINSSMIFPVKSGDLPSLANAMYRHALTCS